MTITLPVTVNVQSQTGEPYPNLAVYVFDGATYTGFNGTSDTNGHATFTLPQGDYRFRADYDGVQFWSAQANDCTLPGCTSAIVALPGGTGQTTTTIDYTYDPLYRLTAADYSTGDSYHYAYDSVGNRLTQESSVHGLSSSVSYNYDIANRLADVDGVHYVYDANGNLLNDGQNTYTYDSANRLSSVSSDQGIVSSYTYNGLGDRLSQDGIHYTIDLNAGLTQVLDDGTTSYTYGLGRISQQSGSTAEYFLGDALGSVRQLTAGNGDITLTKSYDPYGEVVQSSGNGQSTYGYTGETADANGLIYLRARYYNPVDGRFLSRDTWEGSYNSPQSLNRWNYTESNPINYTDPSGNCTFAVVDTILCAMILAGTMGGLAGAGFAAIVAGKTWQYAFDGECSCTDTTKILVYSKAQFVGRAMLAGAGLGVFFGLIAGTGNGPAAGVALVGAIMTGPGIKPAWDKYKASNYQDKCAMVEFMALTIGFGASVFGGLVALSRGVTTGNWINTSVKPSTNASITRGGAVVTEELLALRGTSSRTGDFKGLSGATVEEIVSRVPKDWIFSAMEDEGGVTGGGIRFTSLDGMFEIRIHGPTTNPGIIAEYPNDAGVLGWTLRVGVRNPNYTNPNMPGVRFVDGRDFIYLDNFGNIVPLRSDAGHIPIFGNPYLLSP